MTHVIETTETRTIPVDTEHGGLRIAVILTFLIGGVLAYFLLAVLIPGGGLNLIALIGGFLIGYGLAAVAERLLKQRWPSGRVVQLDRAGVRTMKNGHVQQAIAAPQPVTTFMWHFQTKRRSRVPKGWHVVSLALQQDDDILSVYAFMSPEDFKKFDERGRFKLLRGSREQAENAQGRDALLLAGEQRRLLDVEKHRWNHGAEMSAADFRGFMASLADLFPEWIPLP